MLDQPPSPASLVQAPAEAAPIPADLKALLDVAIAEGDDRTIGKLFDYAVRARPDAAIAIIAMQVAHRQVLEARKAEVAAAEKRKLADAGPLRNWTGQVEFGASWATGPASSFGAVGALDLNRQGIEWTHKVLLRGEVQDINGVRAVERIIASWQPRYAVGPDLYVFGLGQYERDPALGYDERYSAALGAGWSVSAGERVKLALEGGPAFRRTIALNDDRARVAGRGTADLRLTLSPSLDFRQRLSAYYESGTSSGLLSSTLDSKLSDKLSLRFTYEYRVEEDGLPGLSSSGSISRASLVYRL